MTLAPEILSAPPKPARISAGSMLRKGTWGIADQALISGTNFITMVLLARGLGPAAFGAFSLIYGGMLFVNSLQGALILQPHSVISAARKGKAYADYTASTGMTQVIFAAIAALASLAAGLVSFLAGWPMTHLMLVLAPCIVAWQFHEFVRRVLYSERRFSAAFFNDVIAYGTQTIVVAALWWLEMLTAPLALYIIMVTSALAAVVGVWQLRDSLAGHVSLSVFRENWHFGKWLAGAEMGYWASSQLYLYLTGFLLGTAATGVLRAGYVIFGPTRILGFFLRSVLPNNFARAIVDGGKSALQSQVRICMTVAAPLMATYCLLVAVFADPLIRLLYGKAFDGHAMVVVLYSISAFLALMTSIITSALRAQLLSRHLFVSQLYATLVALPVGWLLIKYWRVEGAVLGMILTNVVVGVSNFLAYRRAASPASGTAAADIEEPGAAAAGASHTDSASIEPANALQRLFELLDHEHIRYCVLHGYEELPEKITSDIDCLIAAAALPRRLAALLRRNEAFLGVRIVQWFQDSAHFITLAGRRPDGQTFFLQLHACADYELAHLQLYSGEAALSGRRRHDPFWVPAPAVEFGAYLARRIAKGQLRDEHARRLEELYRQDPAGCRREAARLWGDRSDSIITGAAASSDWATVRKLLPSLRSRQNRRAFAVRPLHFIMNCLVAAARRLRRWWRADRGLNIIFLGPDGSGKSSVVDAVRRDLAPAFVETARHSFPPALLNRNAGTNPTPHAQPQRSFLNSSMRAVCYWFVYSVISHFLRIRPARVHGQLIVHDRHLVDAMVDPRRYRYGGPAWLLRLIYALAPRSDLVILLDAPAEVIQQRKREVPLEETRRQVSAYRALVSRMSNGHVVDAAMPINDVIAAVEAVILDALARRAAHQLGLEARP